MDQRHVRFAWIPLVLINLLILVVVGGSETGPFGPGSVLRAFLARNATNAILEARMLGTVLLAMFVFGLAIILIPFRQGKRWAWGVLWMYPLFFVLHVIAFDTLIPDGVFALICALCLIVPYRVFFPQRRAVPLT